MDGNIDRESELISVNVFVDKVPEFGPFPQPYSERKLRSSFIIDLFSLYVLFSHFRPLDATLGNSFFQRSSYARAHVRINYEETKGKFPENLTWSEMGK